MRINQYLAHNAGVSRREADQMVKDGRVQVNGQVSRIGQPIVEGQDKIALDGNVVDPKGSFTYVLLNKPPGYVSTKKSQAGEPTVYELVPEKYKDLKIVGRLDRESTGLILLTDDGQHALELTHPRFNHSKVYEVGIESSLTPDDLKRIQGGVVLSDDFTSKLDCKPKNTSDKTFIITMHEGKNRQIRRTFGSLGYTVTKLRRIELGKYTLADLHDEDWSEVTKK